MRALVLAALAVALAGAAQAQTVKAGSVSLSSLQLRATVAGVPTSAAYLTIENHGKSADKLLDIACGCADSAMMHRSETKNGISSMSMVGELDIPAGGKVSFTPNGLHVMLVGLKGPLKAGRTQVMTLRFQKAGKVKAAFKVVEIVK